MNVLIVNPIMYTSETNSITRQDSIKDTMIYDFCLAFYETGHDVTLVAAEPFKPRCEEEYPFKILWFDCSFKKIFFPNRIPFMPKLRKYIKINRNSFDMIISKEIFSLASLTAYRISPKKVIVWHELAKHNKMLKRIPSKIWYNIVAQYFMRDVRVIACSNEARAFIKKYCHNTEDTVIDHGVNVDKFIPVDNKENCFAVLSQLIERKRIDGILEKFAAFLQRYENDYRLYIMGDGELLNRLKQKADELGIAEKVVFTLKLEHDKAIPILSRSKALLVNTVKDNNMISIVESIAVGTPIVTTDVPLNASYIKELELGIAKLSWGEEDLFKIVSDNDMYVRNCLNYRKRLSTKQKVEQFLWIMNQESPNNIKERAT